MVYILNMINKIIRYRPSKTMSEFHKCRSLAKGLRGPIGSGKSSACCIELFSNAVEQEPFNGIRKTKMGIIRNTYGELKTTTIKTWLNWFGDLTRIVYSSPIIGIMNFDLPDGTKVECELVFVSQDRPKDIARLLSLELTAAWINEAREVPETALDVTGRIDRYPDFKKEVGATYPVLLMDTNSCDVSCWYHTYSEKLKPEGYTFFDQPGALIRTTYDKEISYAPNPEAENIENLKSGYDYYLRQIPGKYMEWVEVYVLNMYGSGSPGNRIYHNYSPLNHTEKEFDPGLPIHWTNDFNFAPLSSAIIQIDKDENIYCVDEIIIYHADPLQSAIEFADRYKDNKNLSIHIYGDASGHVGQKHGQISNYIKIRKYLEEQGFIIKMHVPRSNPGIRDGQNAVRAKISDAAGRRSFFVNQKKCPTIDEGLMTLQTKKGSTFLEDERLDSQHVLSAVRYFVYQKFPLKFKLK